MSGITNAFPAGGIDEADVNELIAAALANAGGAKIEYGSYIGSNKYGSGNPNSLTFGFEPKLVIIREKEIVNYKPITPLMLFKDATYYVGQYDNTNRYGGVVTWSGNTVSWYTTLDKSDTLAQFSMNVEYRYIAIG